MNGTQSVFCVETIFSGDDGSLLTKAQMIAYYKNVPAEYDRALEPREYTVHLYEL
jgi:hypothetical protein